MDQLIYFDQYGWVDPADVCAIGVHEGRWCIALSSGIVFYCDGHNMLPSDVMDAGEKINRARASENGG